MGDTILLEALRFTRSWTEAKQTEEPARPRTSEETSLRLGRLEYGTATPSGPQALLQGRVQAEGCTQTQQFWPGPAGDAEGGRAASLVLDLRGFQPKPGHHIAIVQPRNLSPSQQTRASRGCLTAV